MMALDMELLAASLGVSIPVLRFLIVFLASVLCSWAWRFMPGPATRNLYAAVTGFSLSYVAFGPSSIVLLFVPILLGYIAMLIDRKHCGPITFVTSFVFLISSHVYFMSGDAWKEGGIDSTGALMVLTLKVISCTMCYQDGLLKDEDLRESQKQKRLQNIPSFLTYLGYCFCCGTHLAGPVYEMQDYIDWTEGKGVWNVTEVTPAPSPYGATLKALAQALFCMGMYLFLSPRASVSLFKESRFMEWNIWRRWGYMWLCGFAARWKYYFIWSISEAAMIISGLGFTGWSNSRPKWDRAENVNILGVELAGSSSELPARWNITVSNWLRFYVYERLVEKGKKPSFSQLLITQVVSAIWHGLYAGYVLFFVHTALLIAGSRAIYRWQVALSEKNVLMKRLFLFFNFLYTHLVLNYACIGFLVLSTDETLGAYRTVYYLGTLFPIAITIILGKIIKPPRKAVSKAKREN